MSTGTLVALFQVFLIPWPTPPKDPAFRQSEEEGKVEPLQDIEQEARGGPAVDMPHGFPEDQACLAATLCLGAMASLEATEFSFNIEEYFHLHSLIINYIYDYTYFHF